MIENTQHIQSKLYNSAVTSESFVHSKEYILEWVQKKTKEINVRVNEIPLNKLNDWYFAEKDGFIRHRSGKFFSIEGITIETNYGLKETWDQPIINQPEIGFLGILTKEINGVLHFLMQAKIEPGNTNIVQISPTLQATRSNYTRIHQGKAPLYLEYFNGTKNIHVLVDQFQSEQGARFLKKRNRNIIIEIDSTESVPVHDDFIWMTLGQLKDLMKIDNLINMDTRTVISSAFLHLNYFNGDVLNGNSAVQLNAKSLFHLTDTGFSLLSVGQIISWITALKFKYDLTVTPKSLLKLRNWNYDGNSIYHDDQKYFSVIGVDVQIGNREVIAWHQPMIKPAQEGILAFIIKKINGVYHFLVQAKVEAGNFDILELAPTVQCLTGNYRTGKNEYSVPFINEVLDAKEENIWHKSYQSEEGGRFYHEQNLNIIVEADDQFPVEIPENYCWMTLDQLNNFMRFNNYLNIGARSLISLISI